MTPPRKKKSSFEIGVNLRVTQCFDKGGRNYMEDYSKYYFEKDSTNNQSVVFAFFGVFDGHGGTEAAGLANECLLQEIKNQEEFWSQDDTNVLQAIRQGFLRTHKKMVDERDKWPRTPSGFKSTAGTTASIAIIRNRKLYVGHVGDSAVVIGYCAADSKDATTDNWCGSALTIEHKPDHPEERRRIEAHGGSVRRKAGIHRVVWNRPKTNKGLTATASTSAVNAEYEEIPFLAVARSLGDLWSYDTETQQYHVSPEPDISVYDLRPNEHRCLIIGSDGLWNVLKPETAVELVRLCERETESRVFTDSAVAPSFFYHPAGTLVQFALERCQSRNVRADNVTALVVMIDPPGKPMTQLRQERRRLLFTRLGLDNREEIGIRRLLVESGRAVGKDACSSPTLNVNPKSDLPPPVLKSPRGKVPPALAILRHALQGPTGFPSLVEGWSDACWKEMLSYCRQASLIDEGSSPPLDAKIILDHLMDMDAKYRKEALQAVPTVLSMKKAFARDHEMSVCLNQIPLLSREWTQLLVMSSSNPSSPTSPCASLSPPILSPVAPPSPPVCRRWLERREKILTQIYQMLTRKLSSELSDDAQVYLKKYIERAVSQRIQISCPHESKRFPYEQGEVEETSGKKKQNEEGILRRRQTRSMDEDDSKKTSTEAEAVKRKLSRSATEDREQSGKRKSTEDESLTRRQTRSTTEEEGTLRRQTRSMDDRSPSPVKPSLRRVGRQRAISRTRSKSESSGKPVKSSFPPVRLLLSPDERTSSVSSDRSPSPPSVDQLSTSPPKPATTTEQLSKPVPAAPIERLTPSLNGGLKVETEAQEIVDESPSVTPWRACSHNRRSDINKNDKAVNDMMEKLVVVVLPTTEELKNWGNQKSKPETAVPKPRPVILPAKAAVKSATVKKRKSESDAAPAKPKISIPELNNSTCYKAFYQRIADDENADAKIEEAMKLMCSSKPKFLSPPPTFLSSKPVIETNTTPVATKERSLSSPTEPKRMRMSDEAPSPTSPARRSLRIRSNKS